MTCSRQIHDRFGLYLVFLRMVGIPVFMKKSKLYFAYEIVANICIYTTSLACWLQILEEKHDLKEMMATLRIAMSMVLVNILHFYMRFYLKAFEELLQITDTFTWEELPARSPTTGKLTAVGWIDALKKFMKYTLIYVLIFHCIQTAYRMWYVENSMVFRAWYPYNYTVSPAYELTNFSQAISSVCGATTVLAFPGLYSTMVAIGRCQFDKIRIMLQAIYSQESSASDAQNQLKECIVLHQQVLEYLRKIEDVLSNCLGAVLFLQMTDLCVLAFSLIISWGDYADMSQSFFIYLVWMTNTFIICWSANELSDAADSVKGSAYEVDWIGAPIPFQRSILLMITRTNQSFVLTAGKFVPVNNETMMN
ncbi:Odorant receptor 77, partial [Blattella germanica]